MSALALDVWPVTTRGPGECKQVSHFMYKKGQSHHVLRSNEYFQFQVHLDDECCDCVRMRTDGAAHFYDQIMDVVKMFYNLQLF